MSTLFRVLILGGVGVMVTLTTYALRAYYRNSVAPKLFDHSDVGADPNRPLLVQFTSPYCYECKVVLPVLKAASLIHSSSFALIDAKERPDLVDKYGVRTTPTIIVVNTKGNVTASWLGVSPNETELTNALVGVAA